MNWLSRKRASGYIKRVSYTAQNNVYCHNNGHNIVLHQNGNMALVFYCRPLNFYICFSRLSQCSTTGVTKAVVCVVLSVG